LLDRQARGSGSGHGRGPATGFQWAYVWTTLAPWLLPIWFTMFALQTFAYYVAHDLIGIDLAIYRHAGEVALAGGNPWIIDSSLAAFAGPPPTLLLCIPVSFLPLPLATVLMMGAGVLAAAWAISRLRLPLWWLLFPPLFEALIVGNPDAFILALLLVRGPLTGLAGVLKIYALVPIVLQRQGRALLVAAAVGALSLPQWPHFIASLETVGGVLGESAHLSAWGTWLMVPVVVALWLLRRRGAEYLVVPGLWPNTRSQYGTMALIAVHRYPVAAAVIGLNGPFLPAIAVIVMAIENWLRVSILKTDPRSWAAEREATSVKEPTPANEPSPIEMRSGIPSG
jgi:hypothetical protein